MIAIVAAYLGIVAWAMQNTSYDVWGGLVVAPVLVVATVPLAARLSRREADPGLARIVVVALVLKLVGSVLRYLTAYALYDGVADADGYHKAGLVLAPAFRDGVFAAEVGKVIGTGFIKILTGIVYVFIGPTEIGGFLVFSWIGFWGLYLFYRAFCLAVPNGDRRRYALLLFFLPSMLFWPSSIGKEAWMTLTLGLTAYAAARLLTHQRGAFLLLVVGLLGTGLVRPHMALVAFASVAIGFLARRTANPTPFTPLARVGGMVVLLGISVVVLGQVEDFFELDKFDSQEVDKVLTTAQGNTSQGGSEFSAPRANTVLNMPNAVASVLFRPFPFEARNAQTAVASVEGMLLLVLFFRSRRRVVGAARNLRSSPYGALSFTYILLFAFAFSSFGNFGIITRQRVQMLPFALVFLALPTVTAKIANQTNPATEQPAPTLAPVGGAR